MDFVSQLKIRGRLILGFGMVLTVMVVLVAITLTQVFSIGRTTAVMVRTDVPAARLSGELATDINGSLAVLSGWMLTGDEQFKADRLTVWQEIDEAVLALEPMVADTEGEAWIAFVEDLETFRTQQAQIEEIANSPAEQPATRRLGDEGKTLTDEMLRQATAILTAEQAIDPTPARRALFAKMGDVRAGIGVAMGALRTYLLSGETGFLNQYNGVWNWVVGRIDELDAARNQLTTNQSTALDNLIGAVEAFSPLAEELLAIRQSARWNEAHFLTRTELAPISERLIGFLSGARDEETGMRGGGIVDRLAAHLEDGADAVSSAVTQLTIILLILLVLGLGLAALVVVKTSQAIVDPVRDMTDAMGQLASGNLETDVPHKSRADELGDMAGAMEVFKENAIERQRVEAQRREEQEKLLAAQEEQRQAEIRQREAEQEIIKTQEGRLAAQEEQRQAEVRQREAEQEIIRSQEQTIARAQRQEELADAFEVNIRGALTSVADAGADMQAAADLMRDTAGKTDGLTGNVARAAGDASANVASVAAAVEELTFSVNAILDQVREASTIAEDANRQSEQTGKQIDGLAAAADRIGEVVNLIAEIAEKTNLLALNATIEAARAGESGKGFAVVANEVKNLANQTAAATKEITAQVEDIQTSSQGAVNHVRQIGDVIARLDQIAAHIAGAVEEQRSAAQDISSSMASSAAGADAVTHDIENVRIASADTGMAAEAVSDGVRSLGDQASNLRKTVETFLREMQETRTA